MRLPHTFFARPTLEVTRDLLGKILVYQNLAGQITEVEAYIGQNDPACHAARGLTPRNQIMFGPPGLSYIYFVYGMYHCLNIITEKKGFPAAILIRGIKPIRGINQMIKNRGLSLTPHKLHHLTNGPGKLCQAFNLTKQQNGIDLCKNPHFYIEKPSPNLTPKPTQIKTTSRIGIKVGQDLPWRFVYHS